MNSQLDNSNDNQDQMLQEPDTFRPVFFDQASKRNLATPLADLSKRSRLDASVIAPKDPSDHPQALSPDLAHGAAAGLPQALTPSLAALLNITNPLDHHRHLLLQHHLLSQPGSPTPDTVATPPDMGAAADKAARFLPPKDAKPHAASCVRKPSVSRIPSAKKSARLPQALPSASAASKAPKLFRRFRSRSLPIINYTSRSHLLQHHMLPVRMANNQQLSSLAANAASFTSAQPSASSSRLSRLHPIHHPVTTPPPALPPINLQSLKEIDLQEILKNPQLRHDILFDPQLQFRPNLDGERGRRKKTIIEKYWREIEGECKQFFQAAASAPPQPTKIVRLPALFTTLRDILLSLLPVKDRAPVNEIMDIDLLVQQLSHGSFDFVAMAQWLGEVFKSHCAPMRDQWVSDMILKFQQAYADNSVASLVQGLRSIFSILEAMKLDVANHQIRILRPVLIETAVDFERDYFNQLINHCKIDISDSLKWFYKSYTKKVDPANQIKESKDSEVFTSLITSSIIDLLSCRNMATEFPSTLAFDHTRLVLLRADVRQLVCVQLCIVLYKQLLANYPHAAAYRLVSSKPENITKVQEEILAIVTDNNGNIKWTRNVQLIALQLVKKVVTNPNTGDQSVSNLPQPLIDFSYNWLIKQIQPNSDVYGLMEDKIFKELLSEIMRLNSAEGTILASNLNTEQAKQNTGAKLKKADSELASISSRISTLVKFHWSVFGEYYSDYCNNSKGN